MSLLIPLLRHFHILRAGGSANPNVTLMFCLLGKARWRKLPVYVLGEMLGAFMAAVVTYFAYKGWLHTL